jgi:hypothetical protein
MFAFQPAIEAQTRQVGYGSGLMQMTSNGDDAIGHMAARSGTSIQDRTGGIVTLSRGEAKSAGSRFGGSGLLARTIKNRSS